MVENILVRKLQIKSGYRMATINAPPDYQKQLEGLPVGVQLLKNIEPPLDFVQIFVKTVSEIEDQAPLISKVLKNDGMLWVCYPKNGSKIKTDLNRDILRKALVRFNLEGVSLISIDNVWSAMRFRPSDKVGK
jgi:hypothetical protein